MRTGSQAAEFGVRFWAGPRSALPPWNPSARPPLRSVECASLLGMSSLIAATAAGPAHGFHREALRVPILWASGVIAVLNLLLLWNESRIRQNPAAAWRLQPLTPKQRRQRWMQLATSIGALLLILAEVVTHPWFHREL